MFIDEPFYDDACLKKIFTGATPHHTSITVPLNFFYVVLILFKKTMYERLGKSRADPSKNHSSETT